MPRVMVSLCRLLKGVTMNSFLHHGVANQHANPNDQQKNNTHN